MTDLRTRLADALREHRFEPCSISECGYLEWWGRCAACGFEGKKRNMRGPEWELNMHSDEVDHQLDVLLSLPGIAIVEVPEGAYVSVRYSRDALIAKLNTEEAAANAAEIA